MPHADPRALYAVIRDIRLCFNRLKAVAERLHADTGITPSMRAVMEVLAELGPRTVPEIARARGVSRQHIQVNMDALATAGLVEPRDNPSHRRSPLFVLTDAGYASFSAIRDREAAVLERLAAEMPAPDTEAMGRALACLNTLLETQLGKGERDV